jgi:hypothetical protein
MKRPIVPDEYPEIGLVPPFNGNVPPVLQNIPCAWDSTKLAI